MHGQHLKRQAYKLHHYTNQPFVFDHTMKYGGSCRLNKPRGLWVSVDDDWAKWCQDQAFAIERLHHKARIKLMSYDRILILKNYEDIKTFSSQYKKMTFDAGLNWNKVKQDYFGIIIAPYCWEARLDFFWYYGWDCASGCIWDLSIVERENNGHQIDAAQQAKQVLHTNEVRGN